MTALKTLRLAKLQATKSYEFHKEQAECLDDIYMRGIQRRRMREDLAYIINLNRAIDELKNINYE